jgi:hypothetical protein
MEDVPRHIMGDENLAKLFKLADFQYIKIRRIEMHIALLEDIRKCSRNILDPVTQIELVKNGFQGTVFGVEIHTVKNYRELKYVLYDEKDVKYHVCLGLWHPLEIRREPECEEDCRNLRIVYEVLES